MLAKKFQQIRAEIAARNYTEASALLYELKSEKLTEASTNLYSALYSLIPTQYAEIGSPRSLDITSCKSISDVDELPILPGISVVTCCMNRNANLAEALNSWLLLPVDEIIIVDWSSNTPVSETIKDIDDPRVKILRVEGEAKWILTYGFNVGLRFARHSKILKFDADIEVTQDFISKNSFFENEYVRGNWKFAADIGDDEQRFVNGSFGANKRVLQEIGYYNEIITTYGWDDSDIYCRLSYDGGCKAKYIDHSTILHQNQAKEERLKYQSVSKNLFFGSFEPTEYYNLCNKYLTFLFGHWHPKLLQNYSIKSCKENIWKLSRITNSISVPEAIIEDAERYAILQLASWVSIPFWRALLNDDEKVVEFKAHFYKGSKDETVLERINEINSYSTTQKWLEQSIMRFIEQPVINSPIECEGLKQNLDIRCGGKHAKVVPLVSLPYIKEKCFSPKEKKRVFVTSLYDENRDDRFIEYLYCIEQNIKVFDYLVLFYENNNGKLYKELDRIYGHSEAWQKIIFVIYEDRPTFEFLFDTADIFFPGDIICVANADIAADESILQINDYIHEDAFWSISRHEVEVGTKVPEGLIMSQLGIPNTFSADMWVYEAPRKYRFKASFPIGSFYCDSFLNYYANLSPFKLHNPCLDLNIYHIHDPVFNSSEEKAIRDREQIEKALILETQLNNGELPLKGSKWCKLEACKPDSNFYGALDWFNTAAKVHVNIMGTNLFQVFTSVLLIEEAYQVVNCPTSIWIMIPRDARDSGVYSKVEKFITSLELKNVFIGVDDDSRIEFNHETYTKSELSASDIVNTVNLIRMREPGQFFHFKHPTYINDSFFGLDFDIAYVIDYYAENNDVATYKLLKQLNESQLRQLLSVLQLAEFSVAFSPFIADIELLLEDSSIQHQTAVDTLTPDITFITSIFKGEEFMLGYLENIAVAAEECNGEVIIVDGNSPQNEQRVFKAFIERNPCYKKYFTYYRLDKDPGLYNCWRYAIERSNAKLISNANLDDRRSPLQAKLLCKKLKENPSYQGAATAIRATTTRNSSWYTLTDNQYWFTAGFEENITFESLYLTSDDGHVRSQNIMHCMPVWRKSLHEELGYFDEESYGTSADWAFWLKCTKHGKRFLLVPEVFSQYFINEQSHNRANDLAGVKENQIVLDYFGIKQAKFIQQ